jgi:hypothetical protein
VSQKLLDLAEADPQAALRLLEELEGLVVRPHAAQRQVLENDARFKLLDCGRRWGKTKIAAHIILKEARKPKQMLWWVAPTYRIVKRGYKEILRQLPPDVLAAPAPPDSNFDAGRPAILKFKNGTVMEFYSAERPEGMLGEGVDFAVLDEAARMPENIWAETVRPTLMDRQGGALIISTPRGRNWFYRAYRRGQDPEEIEWASWKFPSWTNDTLPPGEIETMKDDLPAVIYKQEVEAEFLAAGSNVFIVPEEILQEEKVKPDGHVVFGVDLAKTTDFTVIYGANAKTRENCYYDRFQDVTWPKQRRRIIRAVRRVLQNGATGVTILMDSTGVGDPMVDELEELGFDVIGKNFTTWKDKMIKLLAKDMEDGKAFVLDNDQVGEFEQYELNITPGGRITYAAPAGEHDDVVSAKMLQHWGVVNEGVPDATFIDGVDTSSIYESEIESVLDDNPDDDEMPDDEDWDWDLEEADTGIPVITEIKARTPQELANDPRVWSSWN